VGQKVCLDDVEKRKFLSSPELELQPLGRLSRSQSLHRLSYINFELEELFLGMPPDCLLRQLSLAGLVDILIYVYSDYM
jgi:hypothetical protein